MKTLFSPARILQRAFQARRMPIVSGRRRRNNKQPCLNRSTMEPLEVRVLLSAATHLAFAVQPTDTVAGNSISAMTVNVEDASNNIVTTDNSLVVFSIATGPAGTPGTLYFAVPAHNGVATLEGLAFTTAGSYTLAVNDASLTPAISSSFAITPDVASQRPTSRTRHSPMTSVDFCEFAGRRL